MPELSTQVAREMQIKGTAVRRQLGQIRQEVTVDIDTGRRLVRVRKQLVKLEQAMGDKDLGELDVPNAQVLDRMASAYARLSEVERQLAGRPMPGSLRPRQDQGKRKPSAPSEPETPGTG